MFTEEEGGGRGGKGGGGSGTRSGELESEWKGAGRRKGQGELGGCLASELAARVGQSCWEPVTWGAVLLSHQVGVLAARLRGLGFGPAWLTWRGWNAKCLRSFSAGMPFILALTVCACVSLPSCEFLFVFVF